MNDIDRIRDAVVARPFSEQRYSRREVLTLLARIDELERAVARLTPSEPARHGQNRETDERQVEGAMRVAFNEAWEKFYPEGHPCHHPRAWTAQRGDAIEVVRYILSSCAGDVTAARNTARVLAGNLFLERFLWEGRPRSWRAINNDAGKYLVSAQNPAREIHETAKAEEYDRKMARAEKEAAPVEVGRAALAAIKGTR